MAKKSKMGRPVLPKEKKRVWIGVRLWPEALRVLDTRAATMHQSRGQTLSQILIHMAETKQETKSA